MCLHHCFRSVCRFCICACVCVCGRLFLKLFTLKCACASILAYKFKFIKRLSAHIVADFSFFIIGVSVVIPIRMNNTHCAKSIRLEIIMVTTFLPYKIACSTPFTYLIKCFYEFWCIVVVKRETTNSPTEHNKCQFIKWSLICCTHPFTFLCSIWE